MTARACSLTLGAAIVLGASVARATPSARLIYSRTSDAESCPDEATLRHAVSARVGYDPFFGWAPRTVVASVGRRGSGFAASVSLVDETGISHGTRELRSPTSCDDLLDAVALAIAIAIDPQSAMGPVSPAPPSPPAPPPSPPVPPAPLPTPPPSAPDHMLAAAHERPSASPSPAPRSSHLEAGVGAVASTGFAPGPSAGVSAGAGLRWPAFSMSIEGRVDAPAARSADGGGSVSAWVALGAVVPCGHLEPLFACAVAQAGSLQTSGAGGPEAHSRSAAWWALGGRIGVAVPVRGDVFLRLRADVLADPSPVVLWFNEQPAWTASRVASSLGADVVLRFP